MQRHFQCAEQVKSASSLTKCCACHTKSMSSHPHHIWNVISNARSKYSQHPTSPNAAPATQNQCHQRSAAHMKRHFQCTEQLKSPSNLTKYCACHEILKLKISSETPWSASANRKTIRRYPRIIRGYPRISDDKIVISHPPLRRPYSSHLGDDFVL